MAQPQHFSATLKNRHVLQSLTKSSKLHRVFYRLLWCTLHQGFEIYGYVECKTLWKLQCFKLTLRKSASFVAKVESDTLETCAVCCYSEFPVCVVPGQQRAFPDKQKPGSNSKFNNVEKWKSQWAVRKIYYMDEGKKLTLLPKHCQFRQHGQIRAVEAMHGQRVNF